MRDETAPRNYFWKVKPGKIQYGQITVHHFYRKRFTLTSVYLFPRAFKD